MVFTPAKDVVQQTRLVSERTRQQRTPQNETMQSIEFSLLYLPIADTLKFVARTPPCRARDVVARPRERCRLFPASVIPEPVRTEVSSVQSGVRRNPAGETWRTTCPVPSL